LQDHRKSLNQKCAAALFDHEVSVKEGSKAVVSNHID